MATPAQLCACTLEGPELPARIDAWRQLASRAISHRVEDDRIIATYPNDVRLLEQLRELIAAEAVCCSFLNFSVEERPDSIVTELRVPQAMPAPMKTLIHELIARANDPSFVDSHGSPRSVQSRSGMTGVRDGDEPLEPVVTRRSR